MNNKYILKTRYTLIYYSYTKIYLFRPNINNKLNVLFKFTIFIAIQLFPMVQWPTIREPICIYNYKYKTTNFPSSRQRSFLIKRIGFM